MDPLRAGLARAGRDISEIDIAAAVPVAVTDDVDSRRDAVRPWLAFYLGAMGAREKNFYVDLADRYGHGDVGARGAGADARRRPRRRGDRADARAHRRDGAGDDAGGLDDRLAEFERAGVTTLLAVPSGDREATVRALASAGVTA